MGIGALLAVLAHTRIHHVLAELELDCPTIRHVTRFLAPPLTVPLVELRLAVGKGTHPLSLSAHDPPLQTVAECIVYYWVHLQRTCSYDHPTMLVVVEGNPSGVPHLLAAGAQLALAVHHCPLTGYQRWAGLLARGVETNLTNLF